MMRNLFRIPPVAIVTSITLFFAASISTIGADQGEVIRLSEPVAVTAEYEFYGATLPESNSPISLGELIGNSDKYQGQEVVVETRIAKVCQKKGCFFVATEGASSAEYKQNKRYIHIRIKVPNIPSHQIFNRNSG